MGCSSMSQFVGSSIGQQEFCIVCGVITDMLEWCAKLLVVLHISDVHLAITPVNTAR